MSRDNFRAIASSADTDAWCDRCNKKVPAAVEVAEKAWLCAACLDDAVDAIDHALTGDDAGEGTT